MNEFGPTSPEQRPRPWREMVDSFLTERQKDLDVSHDRGHIDRMLKVAENILDYIGADYNEREVVDASIRLHDGFMYPKDHPLSHTETDIAAEQAGALLEKTDFEGYLIPRVQVCIRHTPFEKGGMTENAESAVVYMADKLDQTGLFAYVRYLASGGKMGRPLFKPDDPFAQTDRERKPKEYTFDAIVDRVAKIQTSFSNFRSEFYHSQFKPAVETAKKRNGFLWDTLKESERELEESRNYPEAYWIDKTGTAAVERLFQEAGRKDKSFYHLSDPLGESGRKLEPEKYPIDALVKLRADLDRGETFGTPSEILERRKKFLEEFFLELEYELKGELEGMLTT